MLQIDPKSPFVWLAYGDHKERQTNIYVFLGRIVLLGLFRILSSALAWTLFFVTVGVLSVLALPFGHRVPFFVEDWGVSEDGSLLENHLLVPIRHWPKVGGVYIHLGSVFSLFVSAGAFVYARRKWLCQTVEIKHTT